MHFVVSSLALVVTARYVLWFAVFCFAVVGAVFAYHWFRWGRNPLAAFFILALYAGGCVILAAELFAIGSRLTL